VPKPDSSAIDAAILARLNGDATLMALIPNGVYFDRAPAGSTKFGIVSVVLARDVAEFHQRALEDVIYLVKAVLRATSAKDAAARIDVLLDDAAPLSVEGYGFLSCHRAERVRFTEPDPADKAVDWFHRGGRYRVLVTPGPST
jgi:hypothetical protein